MTTFSNRTDYRRSIDALRHRADQGDADASFELGCLLEEGVIGKDRRRIIAPAPVKAVAAYRRAVKLGDLGALLNLGVCHDNGIGVRRNKHRALLCYLRLWNSTRDGSAASNIATVHRDVGDHRGAIRWWRKAVKAGDSGCLVDIGYCLCYGIGVRRDIAKALAKFTMACRTRNIAEFDREAAFFYRAVVHLDRGGGRNRTRARALLAGANADNDYPEARALLAQIDTEIEPTPCRCRRGWLQTVAGQAPCALHRRRD